MQANCVLKLNLVSFLGSEVGDIMKLVTEPVSQIVEPVHRYTWASIITNVTNIRSLICLVITEVITLRQTLYCFAAQGGLNILFHSTPAEVDLLSLYPIGIAYGKLLLVLHPSGRKLSY